jgi:hypothetical protein
MHTSMGINMNMNVHIDMYIGTGNGHENGSWHEHALAHSLDEGGTSMLLQARQV